MVGIYIITNRNTLMRYVGQSWDITKRLTTHRSHLKLNKHDNPYLQNAYNKYGKGAFFETIVECSKDELTAMEQYFIDVWGNMGLLYNINKTAGRPPFYPGKPISEEHKARIIESKRKQVPVYNHVEEIKALRAGGMAYSKIAEIYNVSLTPIIKICKEAGMGNKVKTAYNHIEEVKALRATGLTYSEIGKRYNSSDYIIRQICLAE